MNDNKTLLKELLEMNLNQDLQNFLIELYSKGKAGKLKNINQNDFLKDIDKKVNK